MTFFIVVVADNQGRAFTPAMSLIDNARCVDTSGSSRVLASLLNISAMLLLLFLFPSFLVRSVAVFGPQRMWGLFEDRAFFKKSLF